jgi:hypothetical protein
VREDDGVALAFEVEDGFGEVGGDHGVTVKQNSKMRNAEERVASTVMDQLLVTS